MGSSLSIAHHQPLSDVVCDRLRQAIHSGELKPGQRLIQAELAHRLGVSRIPVREALQRLAKEGLVESKPRRGAIVRSPSREEAEEVFATVRILARAGMEVIVERITDADIATLERTRAAAVRAVQSGRLREAINITRGFHRELYAVCGLPKLWECIEALCQCCPQGQQEASEERILVALAAKQEMLIALRARDRMALLDAVDRHLTNTARFACGGLPDGPPDGWAAI